MLLGLLTWGRRLAAAGILIGGVLALNAGSLDTCEQKQSLLGAVSEVCHRPSVDDPVILGSLLIVLLLLAPDVTEFSVFGLASLKWRVRAQEARSDAAEAELREIRASVSALSVSASTSQSTANVNVNVLRDAARESARIVEDANPNRSAPDSPAVGRLGGTTANIPDSRLLAAGKVLAGTGAVRAVLDSAAEDVRAATGVSDVGAHLYLPNDRGLLIPVDDPERPENDSGWSPGAGAVGAVWQAGDAEVRRGPDTQRDLEHLDQARRERYRSTQLVLAVPVTNLNGRVIGVLSASSPQPGDADKDRDALEAMEVHAQAAARTIIDLLGWDTDAP